MWQLVTNKICGGKCFQTEKGKEQLRALPGEQGFNSDGIPANDRLVIRVGDTDLNSTAPPHKTPHLPLKY